MKRLHAEGADQSPPVTEPADDRTGVPVDWTVQQGGAALDDGLRHVGFPLQNWRLCANTHIHVKTLKTSAEKSIACLDGALAEVSPLMRTKDSARMEPTMFSAMHTYVPASLNVTLSTTTELLPASSTVAPARM